MALDSPLQQFAKKSPQYKVMVLGLVIFILGVLYYQFRYSGLAEAQESMESKKTSELARQRQLNQQLQQQTQLQARHEELKRSIRDNQKALPTEAELPAFFDHLQRKAGDASVTIKNWERLEEQPVDIYVRVPIRMEVSGSFYQVMHYFALLGPQTKDPLRAAADGEDADTQRVDERIVSIENLELGLADADDGSITLEAKFIASTFRQKADPKAAEKKKAKPGAKKPGKTGAKKPGQPAAAGSKAGGDPAKQRTDTGLNRMKGGAVPTSGAAPPAGGVKQRRSFQRVRVRHTDTLAPRSAR